MHRILPGLLIALGLIVALGLEATAFILQPQAVSTGPLVVVSLPWGQDPALIVAAAGGQVIGPARAPLAVVAMGATAEALNHAGAFAVLDGTAASFLCGTEEEE